LLRIKLRYDDVDTMVQKFAPNVGKSGLFLPTKSVQPVGAEIKFELRLASDVAVLVGLGRVKFVKEPDPDNPKAVFGMAVELLRVTRESRDVILRMLERRRQLGLVETAIPMPEDIEAARRIDFVDLGVKDASSGAVPAAPLPQIDSRPEGLLTAPRRPTGPMAVAKVVSSVSALAPEPARRKRPVMSELIDSASGPIAQTISVPGLDDDVDVSAVLARARMLAGSDLDAELGALLESSATPIEIGIEAASAELAKALGGAAVRRDRSARWAPPPAISEPVVQPVPEPAPEPEPEAPPAVATEVDPDPVIESAPAIIVSPVPVHSEVAILVTRGEDPEAARERARDAAFHQRHTANDAEDAARALGDDDDEQALHAPAAPGEVITEPRAPSIEREPPADGLIHDEADPEDFSSPPAIEVDPEQIHDEIHQLNESDFEEVEHTQLGDNPVDPAAYPGDEAASQRLDAHLAAVEAEHEHDDLGIGEASGVYRREQLEQAQRMATPDGQGDYIHQFNPGATLDESAAAFGADDVPEEIEEIDDFEILAEADADDADLLQAHGEVDASGSRELALPARPSHSDFASRLDLGDESDSFPAAPQDYYRRPSEFDHEPGELDPRIASAGHALAAFDDHDHNDPSGFHVPARFTPTPTPIPGHAPIFDDNGSHSYTLAGEPSPEDSLEFDAPHAGFPPPHAFDQSDVIDIRDEAAPKRQAPLQANAPTPIYNEPYKHRKPPPGTRAPEVDEVDLESALEALDVDLDDLSIPHAAPGLARETGSQPVRTPGRPSIRPTANPQTGSARVVKPSQVAPSPSGPRRPRAPRASSDDGVLIDFDDDEEK
jgi:hypothetical protein